MMEQYILQINYILKKFYLLLEKNYQEFQQKTNTKKIGKMHIIKKKMDIEENKTQIKCLKHKNRDIILIKINKLEQNNQIFYCDLCIVKDKEFQSANFLHVSQIIDEEEKNLIYEKWPPLNNRLQEKLFKIFSQANENLSSKIEDFFSNFKKEILKKIDNIKKKILKDDRVINHNRNQLEILKEIKNISKIEIFQSILKNEDINQNEKEQQFVEIITKFNEEKAKNNKIFKDFVEQFNQLQLEVNYTKLIEMKDSLNSFLDKFDIFDEKSNTEENNQQLKQLQQKQIQDKKETNFLSLLQLLKSEAFQQESQHIKCQKLQDNSILIVSPNKYSFGSFYSNVLLEREKKYCFRFQFEKISRNNSVGFAIGLINEQQKDSKYQNNLYCEFCYDNKSQGHEPGNGIDKVVRGSLTQTDQINCFELRVCIEEEILEIVDYPNYQNKLSLDDQYLQHLREDDDFRLSIFIDSSIKLTLIKASIVNTFND